jgi:hypothetical protein
VCVCVHTYIHTYICCTRTLESSGLLNLLVISSICCCRALYASHFVTKLTDLCFVPLYMTCLHIIVYILLAWSPCLLILHILFSWFFLFAQLHNFIRPLRGRWVKTYEQPDITSHGRDHLVMHVCVCVYIHTCIHTYTCLLREAWYQIPWPWSSRSECVYARVRTHLYIIHVDFYTCIRTHTLTHTHIIHLHTHT